MRVLVLGSGAREHALAACLARPGEADEVISAPGNPGTAELGEAVPADLTDPDSLIDLAARRRIDLTIVGPELPLSLGVVDRFARDGRPIFGPAKAAARLESSKAFAKAFMARHDVPTARCRICESADEARAVVASGEFGFPIVLKADGLAAGKGVVIAGDRDAALAAISAIMSERRFGAAGDRLVVEECLEGVEASFFVISDGTRVVPLASAQDHKRVFDGDRGPNTGGMGAFAPSPLLDAPLERRVVRDIVEPVIAGMAGEGHPFRGFLYVGLMMTADGPKVIEFNVRLGDPEAQVILPLVAEPLLPLLAGATEGRLPQASCRLGEEKLVGVTIASRGYPESADVGQPIHGTAEAGRVAQVLHGGTAMRAGQLVTAGGRVFTVVGRGATYDEAIRQAYSGVELIRFDGMQYRRDIGQRARQTGRAAPV
jgi:phosphoribosylamine--glycine ligase